MELLYTVRRSSKRRKLTITVERDRSVVVHAPADAPDEAIERVVETRRPWIYEKIHHSQKYRELPHPPGKELVNGESALYLGRDYRIELVKENAEDIRFNQRFFVPAVHAKRRTSALRDWYIERAKARILPRVERHARELGVSYAHARIVDNRYRWGSCGRVPYAIMSTSTGD